MIENRTMQDNTQGQLVGAGVGFERIRRITGYLVGTLDRFNDAKRAEVSERVKHSVTREVKL
ncbi:anaerobic ribonucleoside-triphosphate reductase [Oscillospiraceae bacterium PP1C4]